MKGTAFMGQLSRWISDTASARYAIWLVLLVAVAARLTRWGDDLWHDEALNWFVSKDGPLVAVERISTDFFPPFYNVLLSLWLELVPPTPLMVRLPSIVAGALAVLVVHRLALKLFTPQIALFAALTAAMSPFLALWAQVARPFSVDLLATLGAIYFLCMFLKTHEQTQSCCRTSMLGLVACFAVAAHTNHGTLFFIFFSFFVSVGFVWRAARDWRSRAVLWLIIGYGLVFVLWLPELPLILEQRARSAASAMVEHRPSVHETTTVMAEMFGGFNQWRFLGPVSGFWVALMLYGFWKLRRSHKTWAGFLFCLFAGYIAFLSLLAVLDPVFGRVIQRSFWLAAIAPIFVGAGMVGLLQPGGKAWRKFIGLATLSVLIVVSARGLYNISATARASDWADIKALVSKEAKATDIVYSMTWQIHQSAAYQMPAAFADDQFKMHYGSKTWTAENLPDFLSFMEQEFCASGASRLWLFVGGPENIKVVEARELIAEHTASTDDGRVKVYLHPLRCGVSR